MGKRHFIVKVEFNCMKVENSTRDSKVCILLCTYEHRADASLWSIADNVINKPNTNLINSIPNKTVISDISPPKARVPSSRVKRKEKKKIITSSCYMRAQDIVS